MQAAMKKAPLPGSGARGDVLAGAPGCSHSAASFERQQTTEL
jgi:hypothetical protein